MLWQALILLPFCFQDRRALVCLLSVKADYISAASWLQKGCLCFRIQAWAFLVNAWKFLKHWHDLRKTLPVAVFAAKNSLRASLQWPQSLQGSLSYLPRLSMCSHSRHTSWPAGDVNCLWRLSWK